MEIYIRNLAIARKKYEDTKAFRDLVRDELLADERLRVAERMLKDADEIMKLEEQILRDEALCFFEIDGNKKLHPAVSIAMVKEYDYQDPDVINWAIEHNIAFLLKVNRPAVKKFVDDPTLPVTVTEVASTRIKTDLSEYLPEDNDD